MSQENIDYKKLLKICMIHWFNAEGCCWDGDVYGDPDNLSSEELKAVAEVYNEAKEEYLNT